MIDVAVQDKWDRVSVRAISHIDGSELAISGVSLKIFNDGNTEVVSASGSFSGSVASYTRTWDEATFPTGRYRIEWTITAAATVYALDQNFEVVTRRFRRPSGESDFTARHPYLSSMLPTGSTFAGYLDSAWGQIEEILYARLGKYPGQVVYPEQFSHALEQLTLANIYQAISIGPGSEDDHKSTLYREQAMSSLDTASAFVRIDLDEDKSAELNEFYVVGNGELMR